MGGVLRPLLFVKAERRTERPTRKINAARRNALPENLNYGRGADDKIRLKRQRFLS